MPASVHMVGLKAGLCSRLSCAYVQRPRSVKRFSEASTDEATPKRKKDIKSTIGNIDSLLGIEEEVKVPARSPQLLSSRVLMVQGAPTCG